jgi:hypothetical protein
MDLVRNGRWLFGTAAAYLAPFAAGGTGLVGGEPVAFAALVRGAPAFAGNAALLFGRHGGETAAAFFAYAPGWALGRFAIGRKGIGRVGNKTTRTHISNYFTETKKSRRKAALRANANG